MRAAHYFIAAVLVLLLSFLLVIVDAIRRQRMQSWVATWPVETFDRALITCNAGRQDFGGTDCSYVWAVFAERHSDRSDPH